MKLIVGFGNPESKYNFTRHNTGFLILDFYTKVKKLEWESAPKFNTIYLKSTLSELGITGKNAREQVIFIKPQTYYNNVGESIQAFSHFYKIASSDILIVCDDFNLDFGKLRLREKGSAGGNNGLKSTIKSLGTEDFPRLRFGTDSSARAGSNLAAKSSDPSAGKISDIDFVLSKFTPSEKAQLPDFLRAAVSSIDDWLKS